MTGVVGAAKSLHRLSSVRCLGDAVFPRQLVVISGAPTKVAVRLSKAWGVDSGNEMSWISDRCGRTGPVAVKGNVACPVVNRSIGNGIS